MSSTADYKSNLHNDEVSEALDHFFETDLDKDLENSSSHVDIYEGGEYHNIAMGLSGALNSAAFSLAEIGGGFDYGNEVGAILAAGTLAYGALEYVSEE